MQADWPTVLNAGGLAGELKEGERGRAESKEEGWPREKRQYLATGREAAPSRRLSMATGSREEDGRQVSGQQPTCTHVVHSRPLGTMHCMCTALAATAADLHSAAGQWTGWMGMGLGRGWSWHGILGEKQMGIPATLRAVFSHH
ncbi:hypothetical protein MRB53_004214 [Persea americana]|nr:hypothetical protein MRB53_004214 [Persea americana]